MKEKYFFDSKFTVVKYILGIEIFFTLLMLSLLFYNVNQIRKASIELAKNEAIANFNKDVAFRYWVTKHGGVYVPVTEETPPNPFLSHIPDRDITTQSGKKLTLMNPAYMLRQTMTEYYVLYGVKGHITSLNFLRPETSPDNWEIDALKAFETGVEAVSEIQHENGEMYFRLMRPLVTKEGCLKCHAHQGYTIGDIRGGVSVSVNMAKYNTVKRSTIISYILSYCFLWLLGSCGIVFAGSILNHRIKERLQAEANLKIAYGELEIKVQERTSELSASNEMLKKEIGVREQTEAALQETKERYEELFSNTGSGVAVYDVIEGGRDFIFKDFNKAAERIDKQKKEELLGRSIFEMRPGIEKFGLIDAFRTVLETGIPARHPVSMYQDEKITGWYENYVYQIPSGEIVVVFDDITQQKKAEIALEESEILLRTLVENQGEGVGITDLDNRFVFANPSAESIFGVETGTLIGRSLKDFLSDTSQEIVRKESQLREAKKKSSYELEIIRPDGSEIPLLITVTPQVDADGNVVGSFGVFRDYTEQKKILDRIQKSEKQTDGLEDFIPICASCFKIRDDEKDEKPWIPPAVYISDRLPEIRFSHGMCPDCMKKWYPGFVITDSGK